MKDYKTILAAVALGLSVTIIGVFTISVFNYIAFLKEQNYSLLDNINYSINQLKKSVIALESDESINELVVLRSENMDLKKQTEKLRNELNRFYEKQGHCAPAPVTTINKDRPAAKIKDDGVGNRGFLLKEGKPN
ncbi:MAG: hypothetical protein V2A59_03975 [Candidatus Omnitrophota bacterium]